MGDTDSVQRRFELMTEKCPAKGGDPDVFARCADCGKIYPAQETTNGSYRPIGTDGSCNCGNEEFRPAL